MTRTIICIPTYDGSLRAELLPFLSEAARDGAEILPIQRRPLDVARNLAVEEARQRKCDILIQLDQDTAPPEDAYHALITQASKEPCLAALPYTLGNGCASFVLPGTTGTHPELAAKATGILEVTLTAVGAAAFHMDIFKDMPQPYFEHAYTNNHAYQTDTEDMVFCKRCKAKKYVLADYWCDHHLVKKVGRPRLLSKADLRTLDRVLTN